MKNTTKTLLRFALRSAAVLSVVWLLLLLVWAAEGA